MTIDWTAPPIESRADAELAAALARRIGGLTKPLGALGTLEALMLQLGLLQGRLRGMAVLAGDSRDRWVLKDAALAALPISPSMRARPSAWHTASASWPPAPAYGVLVRLD